MPDWSAIASQLEPAGIRISTGEVPRPVSGGDISAAWRLASDDGDVFIKTGPLNSAEMFAAEADGLTGIAASGTVRVPSVIAAGRTEDGAFLALEWLDLGRADANIETQLGKALADMHANIADRFGWHRDNFIGLTPQRNPQTTSWTEFFRDHRLGFQLQLAAKNGYRTELQSCGELLLKRLPKFFSDSATQASLLHGDLWGGNWGSCNGQALIFDPAVYYGDRESDIAMTKLFGGFGHCFYAAYESRWPRSDGYQERECLYQLYHVLNHLNLFGQSYLGRAVAMINRLL